MPASASSAEFLSWFKRLRRTRRLTQNELGRRLGYSGGLVREVESGRDRPSTAFVASLAELLHIPAGLRDAFVDWIRGVAIAPEHLEPLTRMLSAVIALNSQPVASPSLPVPLTRLIGRDRELALAASRLRRPDVRLLTLVGAPGIGKTRLAIEVASTVLSSFPDGVHFVPLSTVRGSALVVPTIARTFGIVEEDPAAALERIAARLRDRHALLVLDNFEHVLAAAPSIGRLLASTLRIKALVTSREALAIYGEYRLPVPPLDRPEVGSGVPIDDLAAVASVALFVERVGAIEPTFGLTNENAEAVALICRSVDGLPLAIELAAAQCLPPANPHSIAARLDARLDLLVKGPSDAPGRLQTLRGAVDWSHDLLSADEQAIFRGMGVFMGGCGAETARAVLGRPLRGTRRPNVPDALRVLRQLRDKSLVIEARDPRGELRFSMLESIREYALERLDANSDRELVWRRLVECLLELAERAAPELTSSRQAEWLDRLEQEHPNLRVALGWTIDARQAELGLRLAGALWRFWWARGYLTEGRRLLAQVLAIDAGETIDTASQSAARALALSGSGSLAYAQADYAAALELYVSALDISNQRGDVTGRVRSLNNLGLVECMMGEYAAARRHLHEVLRLLRQTGRVNDSAHALNTLAVVALRQCNYAEARGLAEQSLTLFREQGHQHNIALVLSNLGIAERKEGNYDAALRVHNECLTLRQALGDRLGISGSLINLGIVERVRGNPTVASTLFRDSLRMQQELRAELFIVECLEGLATVAVDQHRYERAASLFGAARARRDAIHSPLPPYMEAELEQDLTAVRLALGDVTFRIFWEAGLHMSAEEAIEFALTE